MFENGVSIPWYQPEWIDWRWCRKMYRDSTARAKLRLESGHQTKFSYEDQMLFEAKNYTSGNLYLAIRMGRVMEKAFEKIMRGN